MGNTFSMAVSAETHEFRSFLQNEFARRQAANSGYSLRDFARFLELNPSFLSKILSGKRRVTLLSIRRIADRLNLTSHEMEFFQRLHVQSPRPALRRHKTAVVKIAVADFNPIAEWYFAAILEASTLANFQPTVPWIVKNLRIGSERAQVALTTLESQGFFKRTKAGTLTVNDNLNSIVPTTVSTPELKRLQKQFLHNAMTAVDEIDLTYRDNVTLVLAMPSDRVAEAKKLLKAFRRKLTTVLQRPGKRDAVFQIAFSLSPLTPVGGKKHG